MLALHVVSKRTSALGAYLELIAVPSEAFLAVNLILKHDAFLEHKRTIVLRIIVLTTSNTPEIASRNSTN